MYAGLHGPDDIIIFPGGIEGVVIRFNLRDILDLLGFSFPLCKRYTLGGKAVLLMNSPRRPADYVRGFSSSRLTDQEVIWSQQGVLCTILFILHPVSTNPPRTPGRSQLF